MRRLLVLSAFLALCGASPAGAQEPLWTPGDQYWSDQFGLPQVSGHVYCAAEYQGKLVIGGAFERIGDVPAANLAIWNGVNWASLGGGTNGPVRTLLVHDSDLIVAGAFLHAGSQAAAGIARWNGSGWGAYGLGLSDIYGFNGGGVSALAWYRDQLVAGGDFTYSGMSAVRAVARWNGSLWVPMALNIDGAVRSLVVSGDTLVAGGSFQHLDAASSPGVAWFDGTAWGSMGAGFPPQEYFGNAEIWALAARNGQLYAGGRYGSFGSAQVARWNGSSWDDIDNATGPVTSLLAGADTLYIGGYWGVRTWPTDWDPNPRVMGEVDALTWYGGALLAAGDLQAMGGALHDSLLAVSITARRAGAWTPLIPWTDTMHGLGPRAFIGVTALETYRDELVAFGVFSHYGGPASWERAYSLAAWNGTSWHPFPDFIPCGYGSDAKLVADGDTLYFSGNGACPPTYNPTPVLRFDGVSWSPLDTLGIRVEVMARYRDHLFVAGERNDYDSLYPSEVYQWTGTRWDRIGSAGYSNARIAAMTVWNDRLIVAGRFDSMNDIPAASIAAWDGSTWSGVGRYPNIGESYRAITALTVHRGHLIAGSTGDYPSGIASWDGTGWSWMGGLNADVTTLASVNGDLFAGVRVWWYGGPTIMHWNERSWEGMGAGTNGAVYALQPYRGSLYAGGDFTRAGSHASFSIAAWNHLRAPLPAPRATLAAGVPNPFRTTSAIHYQLQEASGVHIVVCNVQGRRIRVLEHAWRDLGDHAVTWDGRDDDGRSVASGVYYVQLLIGEQVKTSQKIVLLR